MINMAFMPLYMWEMWDVTPVTHEHTNTRTHEQWKVEQYSVWAESAINQVIILTVREYVREDPSENEEKANNVQKIGANMQNAKVLKKSINWVNKMNIIGKDCINIVLLFQNELRFVSSTFVSEKRVLPVAVFIVLMIYAIVAAIFYSEC